MSRAVPELTLDPAGGDPSLGHAGGLARLRSVLAGGAARLQAITPMELSVTVTLLLLLLYGDKHWYVRVPVSALCIAGLLYRPMTQRLNFWLIMSSLLAAGTLMSWYSADNHKYLMAYWCVALACAVGSRHPAETLATSARWLIGLCFLFAAGWKLWSPDFRDGSFFELCMLSDQRFFGFTQWATGISREELASNARALGDLTAWYARGTSITFASRPVVDTLAQVLAAWTLVIESWVAVAFLAPRRTWLSRWRDVPLFLFVVSTYAVATVAGFALVLIAMGLSQCRKQPVWIPLGYLAAIFLLQAYMLPWSQIATSVAQWAGGSS